MKKKFVSALLAGTMLLALAACGGGNTEVEPTPTPEATEEVTNPNQGDATFTTVEPGKLHMSTNASFPPYEMLADGAGVADTGFEGIDVEVAAAIAEKLGLELVVDDMEFSNALTAAQNGQSDMVMAGVTVTEERQAVMDFSDSYATGVQVVIVKEGSPVTMDNLGDYMIGCQADTTGYIYASDTPENGGYGEDHVMAYDNGALAVEALKGGQVQAVIIDNEPAKAYVAANAGLTLLEGDWVTENYAIGVKKGNTELLDAINKAIQELKDDGTFQDIVDKYISAE